MTIVLQVEERLALALEGEGGLGCGFVFSEAFLWIPFPFLGIWGGGVSDEVGDGSLG